MEQAVFEEAIIEQIIPHVNIEGKITVEPESDQFTVTLGIFEGHFDALLDMVEKKDLDVCDICLTDVIKQYLTYISLATTLNLSYASEFMYTAAWLMELKTKRILPLDEQEEEIELLESSLIDHIAEYKIFKLISQALKVRKILFSKIFHRFKTDDKAKEEKQYFLKDVNASDLVDAFRRVWELAKEREEGHEIVDEVMTVEDKIKEIKVLFASGKGNIEFERIFKTRTRLEVIVTFLAVLEMMRTKEIKIKQEAMFGQIFLFSHDDARGK